MDISPKELRENILKMATVVEATLLTMLKKEASLQDMFELENKVNEFHKIIDDLVFKYIALKSPAAKDLRSALAIMKINSELERMSDQALKIKRHHSKLAFEVKELDELATDVAMMVKNSIDSFVKTDIKMATDVIQHDQEINTHNRDIIRQYIQSIKQNEVSFDDGYRIIKMSKNLERIGDHAKNVAEDVIFLESGSDIRHRGSYE